MTKKIQPWGGILATQQNQQTMINLYLYIVIPISKNFYNKKPPFTLHR